MSEPFRHWRRLTRRDSSVISGNAAIREAINGLLTISSAPSIEPLLTVRAPGVALRTPRWRLTGTDHQVRLMSLGGRTSDVACRQPDGTWRLAIDNRFGDVAAGAPQAD